VPLPCVQTAVQRADSVTDASAFWLEDCPLKEKTWTRMVSRDAIILRELIRTCHPDARAETEFQNALASKNAHHLFYLLDAVWCSAIQMLAHPNGLDIVARLLNDPPEVPEG
jgi:hypothetical protein